jgi:hypothetical protein
MTENITIFISTFLENNGILITPTGRSLDGYTIDDSPKIDILQYEAESQVVLQTEYASMSVMIGNELAENDPKLNEALNEFLKQYTETKMQVDKILGVSNTIQ